MKFLFFTAGLLLTAIFAADVSAQKATNGGAAAKKSAHRAANADMNGDGKTDWFVTRAGDARDAVGNPVGSAALLSNDFFLGKSHRERMRLRGERELRNEQQSQNADAPASNTQIHWFTSATDAPASFAAARFGTLETDFPIFEDFDGDGKDDIAVWRPKADGVGVFIVMQSSNGAVTAERFGKEGDDPTVVGDYDGDGKADPAVFRCPTDVAAQCFFYYRGSLKNPKKIVTEIAFGFGTANELTAAPGDYDGDGKLDFCIQRRIVGDSGQFVLLRSSDKQTENVNWGRYTDRIVPGDFDGDGRADFMVTRPFENQLAWFLLTRTGGGTGTSPIVWGLSDSDYETPGDFDGDGKTDVAVWRPDADPDKNFYWVKRSSDEEMMTFEWGMSGDYPAQNWYVH